MAARTSIRRSLEPVLRVRHQPWRIVDAWRRRAEIEALLALCVTAGGLFGFAQLADEVVEGEARAFDEAVLLALRDPAGAPLGPSWLEAVARDITALGGLTVLTLVTLAALGFLLIVRKRGAALLVLAAAGGGTALSFAMKALFARPRPDLVEHGVQVATASFPSAHAMLAAVTYLTLGALLARVQPMRRVKAYLLGVAITLTLLIGLSRVYLGVHWPTDVLAGWCVGGAWATTCWLVANWLQARGRVERDVAEAGVVRSAGCPTTSMHDLVGEQRCAPRHSVWPALWPSWPGTTRPS